MTLFEFFIFGLYLATLTIAIVGIQIVNPGKAIRENLAIEDMPEKTANAEMEEPDSEEDHPPFNPETEDYTMTENPMLRHRNVEQQASAMEMVD